VADGDVGNAEDLLDLGSDVVERLLVGVDYLLGFDVGLQGRSLDLAVAHFINKF
jgi:hypothetical protein